MAKKKPASKAKTKLNITRKKAICIGAIMSIIFALLCSVGATQFLIDCGIVSSIKFSEIMWIQALIYLIIFGSFSMGQIILFIE